MTQDDEALCERLRSGLWLPEISIKAAARIYELSAEVETLRDELADMERNRNAWMDAGSEGNG